MKTIFGRIINILSHKIYKSL